MSKNVDISLKSEHITYERSFTTDDTEAVDETLRMVAFVVGRVGEGSAVPAPAVGRTGARTRRTSRTPPPDPAGPKE